MAESDSILTPWWAVHSYLSIHGSVGVCVSSLHYGDSAAVAAPWMVRYEPVWTSPSYTARSEFGGSHSLHVVHADGTLSTPPSRVRIPVFSDSFISCVPFTFCSLSGSEVLSHRGFDFCFLTD